MKIIEVEIGLIKPYEKNAKKHPKSQIENVANSIKKYGWQQPIVVDKDYVIIIGHCRYLAAQELGLDHVPVVVADKLNDEQVKALRLVDNKTNESDWDYDFLKEELLDLDLDGFNFDWNFNFETFDEEDEPEDEFDEENNLVEKHLLKCPYCGYVNEEKAFKNIVDGIENEDTD